MYKILIVDDEERIRNVIATYAKNEGYEVTHASNGLEAIDLVLENKYDILILDIMMPKLDGFSTLKRIRETSDTPVIMLSARQEEYDKLYGFELGVDDYVTKPFSVKELMARISAILRRDSQTVSHKVFQFEGLKVDVDSHIVEVNGEIVHLTPKEFEVLHFLILNKNKVVTRERFLTELWNYDYFGDDRTIDTHIKMLRSNLQEYRKFIVTVRGIGYRFED
ncbi:MAG: response regulator transcription factor [Erysipelothrix sp.]|nr:response regulator transcription factor [Erysipelothrix sp.]